MKLFKRKVQRRALDEIEFATVLGEGLSYRGDVNGEGNYLVKGEVRGNCDIAGHLVLLSTARWTGDVAAAHIVVAGEVIGDVYASAKLELKASARVRGNITSPLIAMADGAAYDGDIRAVSQAQILRFNEKRSDRTNA
jgi:cytoskeletal protein CcmA (bactofilin family)